MNFSVNEAVPVATLFLQGLLSFFSPCVLPLVPLYIGYLSGGARSVDENGEVHYRRGRVLLNTLFFILGVSFAFAALGLGVTAAGQFFSRYQRVFVIAGGVLIIAFGLYQLGIFGTSKTLSEERRLPFRLDKLAMNPFTALLMGFVFSFAWTPCVGPALSSVLIMASSTADMARGFLLIAVYTLGFVLPFLALGFFTGTVLELFKKHRNVVKYTVKVGGVLMIFMGVMMITGWLNGFSSYFSTLGTGTSQSAPESTVSQESGAQASSETSQPGETSSAPEPIPAWDFTLTDQYGETHTLSDYKGKTVVLNFWTTWCGYCKQEMPDFQSVYEDYGKNGEEVIILGMANPGGQDKSEEVIKEFLTDGGYTYPVLMDTTGESFTDYFIRSFPTTFIIDTEGNVAGYVPGLLTKEQLVSGIEQFK